MKNNAAGPLSLTNSAIPNHISEHSGWVIYRLPGEEVLHFLKGDVKKTSMASIPANGFVVAPFFDSNQEIFFLNSEKSQTLTREGLQKPEFQHLPFFKKNETTTPTSQNQYCSLVEKALEGIDAGLFTKVVPASASLFQIHQDFNIFKLYKELSAAYPNAFVYVISSPETGTWIGCSPEWLLRSEHNTLKTVALAGTRKINSNNNASDFDPFTPKEFEEQAIVTRYIYRVFEKYCSEVQMEGPEYLLAGNVVHLATKISGKLLAANKNNFRDIIEDLHPTPAVCGLPLAESRAFLLAEEDFNRELYSGYLGPVRTDKTDLFVNLRCMQILDNNLAILYAGAGVVAGSDPLKEWLETREKMQTLKRYL